MNNYIVLAYYTEFKPGANNLGCNEYAAICLY